MMKKIFTVVLVLCSLSAWAHDFEVDGIYYNKVGKDSVEVTFKGESLNSVANEYIDTVVIPATVDYEGTVFRVVNLGQFAFAQCELLKAVVFTDIERISWGAFWGCKGIKSITITESVKTIESFAFYDCENLATIYCKSSTPPEMIEGAFDANNETQLRLTSTLYVPCEAIDVYKAHDTWGTFQDIQCVPEVETSLHDIQSPVSDLRKFVRDGQLVIVRDGAEYNAQGLKL